jgi:DNA-nicking Smr family endonuclease
MKARKDNGLTKPFEALKSKLEEIFHHLPEGPPPPEPVQRPAAPECEKRLFADAMADVQPIRRGDRVEPQAGAPRRSDPEEDPDSEALMRLKALIDEGEGFIVSATSEYIEGTGYAVNPRIAGRLHRGDFSIEGHIDLHGLGVAAARESFDGFIREAVLRGKRAVLIIHGRGLSSPHLPVLKTKVVEWLTYGPWRKRVIAFASARACDGGAGATYVLLRRAPFKKKTR